VAEILCVSSACYYQVRNPQPANDHDLREDADTTAVMKALILSSVVPNIRRRLPDDVAFVLGKALLWLIFSPFSHDFKIPEVIVNRAKTAVADARGVDGNNDVIVNPIVRRPVFISGNQGLVYIDLINEIAGGADAEERNEDRQQPGGDRTTVNQTFQNHFLAMQSSLNSMRCEIMDLKTTQSEVALKLDRHISIVKGNMRRLASQIDWKRHVQPREADRGAAGGEQGRENADAGHAMMTEETENAPPLLIAPTLMAHPRSLSDLWLEFTHGVGGRKPARLFNFAERGRVKHKYHRRKVVWDIIAGLVRQGFSANAAIERIEQVYGSNTCVTHIINAIKRDKKNGTLSPNLRI
jgi:hypothetical protein